MYTYKKKCDHYSSAETIQGRKLLIIKRFWPRKLFKGGNYSRAETIRENTVFGIFDKRPQGCYEVKYSMGLLQGPRLMAWTRTSEELDGTLPRIASFENT